MLRPWVAILCAVACSPALPNSPSYDPERQTKCQVAKSATEPLIVEWPSAARAKLEAQVRRGVVVVHYTGCELRVLDRCTVSGARYAYVPLTKKRDHIVIRTEDELYANLPVHAANLEAKLGQSGELDVDLTIVGRLESPKVSDLQGDCDAATHVITALTVGAFEFHAGAERHAGGGVGVQNVGVGTKTAAARETLATDGDRAACDRATLSDQNAPEGCGALLRLDLHTIAARRATPAPATKRKPIASGCPRGMVAIPGATFDAGTSGSSGNWEEPPRHTVSVKPFCIDRTEVTVTAYAECIWAKKCTQHVGGSSCNFGRPGTGAHPMNCVLQGQAEAYCKWKNGRLPTEHEWELAARGTDGRSYPWGNDAPSAQLCWRRDKDTFPLTCRTGAHPAGASPYGVLDMAGNVSEWTSTGVCDASGNNCISHRYVVRGGAAIAQPADAAPLRSARREGVDSSNAWAATGFRCVAPAK